MCGINGIISPTISHEIGLLKIKGMNLELGHRGPDNDSFWNEGNVFLGHRRLSIIDLSKEANQPFHSIDARYVIVYNGELYNYKDLRFELQRAAQGSKPYLFKTNTDTEVILAAYIRWGQRCLDQFNGMYAFAIWDRETKELFVARDRMGIKPFYYYHAKDEFIFSSEIRPLIKSKLFKVKLNETGLSDYIQYQTVHAPDTIIENINVLMPGHYAKLKEGELKIESYWELNKLPIENSVDKDYSTITSTVNSLLCGAVERRLVSDVPFGAFLSGGIDSSSIVGLMSQLSSDAVNTFSITFDESEFNESQYSNLIAKRFNTKHNEIRLSVEDFLKDLPEALYAMDHPSGDGPNTYVVSKATKNAGITMALSGLGGDELFCGYDVFKRALDIRKKHYLNFIPRIVRSVSSEIIRKNKTIAGEKKADFFEKPILNFDYFYPISRRIFSDKFTRQLLGKTELPFNKVYKAARIIDVDERKYLLSKCSVSEMTTYMQNVLLRDTDQMSMAVALEVRVPFLDYQLVEYVLSLKDQYKIPTTPKKLLTDSLKDLLPEEIINRPKMGFTLPWKEWMKNELSLFCSQSLNELAKHTSLNKFQIEDLWRRFIANDPMVSWSRVWHLVVLGNWLSNLSKEVSFER